MPLVLLRADSKVYPPDLQGYEALDLGLISSFSSWLSSPLTSQCMQAQIIWVRDGTHLRFLGLWVALRVGQLCLGRISPCTEEQHSPCPLPTYFQIKSYQVGRNHMPSTTLGKKIPNENKYFSIVRERRRGNPTHTPCV